jgi:hypothetical protein
MNARSGTALVLAALLPGLVSGQTKKVAPAYLLRFHPLAGKALQYRITTKVSGFEDPSKVPGQKDGVFTTVAPFTETVSAIESKIATVYAELGPFKLAATGAEVIPLVRSAYQVDPFGACSGISEHLGPEFSKESVKVGGSWHAGNPLNTVWEGAEKGDTTYRLLSIRKVHGKRLAELGFHVLPHSGLLSGSGKLFVELATGVMTSCSGSYEVLDAQAGPDRYLQVLVTVETTGK